MNKELSKEEIRIKWIRHTPLLHLDDCVDNAMQQYADQEKKKEAIAVLRWAAENIMGSYFIGGDGRWELPEGVGLINTEQLYELFNQQK